MCASEFDPGTNTINTKTQTLPGLVVTRPEIYSQAILASGTPLLGAHPFTQIHLVIPANCFLQA